MSTAIMRDAMLIVPAASNVEWDIRYPPRRYDAEELMHVTLATLRASTANEETEIAAAWGKRRIAAEDSLR
jgi:hypothetical protein